MTYLSKLQYFTLFNKLFFNGHTVHLVYMNKQLHMQTIFLIKSPNYADLGFCRSSGCTCMLLYYTLWMSS